MAVRINGTIDITPTNYTASNPDDISSHLAGIDTALGTLQSEGIQVGEMIAWAGETIPSWALECDGSEINRTTYNDLFTAISTTYGTGNGTTTFDLPDFRGRFLCHTDGGAAIDADRASRTDRGDGTTGDNVGTLQGYNRLSHNHGMNRPTNDLTGGSGNKVTGGGSGTTTNTSGGNEDRPNNIYVYFIIAHEVPST